MMSCECKICGCQFFEGNRMEITLTEGSVLCVYVCDSCRDKYPQEEIRRVALIKFFH
jgi:ribosome-binding protein aMBF1 (putative translation factor)